MYNIFLLYFRFHQEIPPVVASSNLSCGGNGITVSALNCDKISGNDVTTAVAGGAVGATCKQNCTNNSTCYKIQVLSKGDNPKPTGDP